MEKLEKVISEAHKSIEIKTRKLYPRGLELHPKFISVFLKQLRLLESRGMDRKSAFNKVVKALEFHLDDAE